ncbi:MAG: hypothetical protein EPN62_06795 [Candidimonas sp.]|nr:MAG: hypothetical protein EPN77_10395 [Candidimonas sp.]TAM24479.1 MAG: hypothetical protein EPN62_06795 [Candidimonas sp.]
MSVYKRGAVWRAEIKSDKSGEKKVRITRTFDTKAEALAFERQQLALIATARKAGRTIADGVTVGEALELWWGEAQSKMTESYRSTNKYRVGQWCRSHLADCKLSDLTLAHLQGWVEGERDRDVCESTIRNCLYIVRNVFKHAKKRWKWELHDPTPDALADVGHSNKRDRRLSEDEYRDLLNVFSQMHDQQQQLPESPDDLIEIRHENKKLLVHRHDSLLYIKAGYLAAIECGMRRTTLFGMKWSWINWKERVIEVPSQFTGPTNKRVPSKVPISPILLGTLKALNGSAARIGEALSQPVFGGLVGDRAYRLIKAAAELIGADDLRWHDLRHEACSRLAEQGWTPQQIQAVSGHRTLQSLQRYMHIRPEAIHKLWDQQKTGS